MMKTDKTEKLKKVVKNVRHNFTPDEKVQYGSELAQGYGTLRGIESEFEKVKAAFKSRTAEAESSIDRLSTNITNGFEYRDERCVLVLFPKDSKKSYYLEKEVEAAAKEHGEPGWVHCEPALTEAMTDEDFQANLLEAESLFEAREEIQLFPPAGESDGVLVVGRLKDKWYSALRVNIQGQGSIEERLDMEQSGSKKRPDAVKRTVKRFREWVVDTAGKEVASGFDNDLDAVIEAHKEREE